MRQHTFKVSNINCLGDENEEEGEHVDAYTNEVVKSKD